MIRRKLQNLRLLLISGDAVMVAAAFLLVFKARFTFLPAPRGIPEAGPYGVLLFIALLSSWLSLALNGLYRLEGAFSRIEEIFKTLLAVVAALY